MKFPKSFKFGRPVPAYGIIVAGATVAAAAIAAGGSMYAANQQKKSADKALQAQKDNQLPQYKLRPAPGFIPTNFGSLNKNAIVADQEAYQRSDADFKARHGDTVKAEKLFETQTLKDQQGESELMPAIQNEFMRAGLQNSLNAFGSTPGSLTPGSAGEASVARNLGLSILGFQDRNRQNRQASLRLAEELFQRRQFGLNGSDQAQIETANTANQNAFNQQVYANQVSADEKNYNINAGNQNAMTTANNAASAAKGQADAAMVNAAGQVVSSGINAFATYKGRQQANPATPDPYATAPKPNVIAYPSYQQSMNAFAKAA